MRVVMLRIGIVLGLGGGALHAMLVPFKMGLGGPVGKGEHWMPWVSVDDVIGIILHAIEHSNVKGPVNATAPNPVRNREFNKTLAQVLRRPAFLPAPVFVLKLLLGEFADLLYTSQRIVPQRIQQTGYKFRHPTLEGALRAILA